LAAVDPGEDNLWPVMGEEAVEGEFRAIGRSAGGGPSMCNPRPMHLAHKQVVMDRDGVAGTASFRIRGDDADSETSL
jgi:hypothetical protein